MSTLETQWPKIPPVLSEAQKQAREKYMALWHEQLPGRYGFIEKFNHGFPVSLGGIKKGFKTLEIGAGLGAHAEFEDLDIQDYHFFEYREEFCKELRKRFPNHQVVRGDIQEPQPWQEGEFDRIIAIHVLEHVPNLPLAVREIDRLLKKEGFLDIVLPCEGGFAHTMGRKLTAERLFKKHFKMDFKPICKNEHVSTFPEIMEVLKERFVISRQSYFPSIIPIHSLNFIAGFRLVKRK